MSAVELQLDIDEFEALLEASERPNVKAVLEKEKARLEAEIKSLESKAKAASTTSSSEVRACKRVQRLRAALTACPRSLLIVRLLRYLNLHRPLVLYRRRPLRLRQLPKLPPQPPQPPPPQWSPSGLPSPSRALASG